VSLSSVAGFISVRRENRLSLTRLARDYKGLVQKKRNIDRVDQFAKRSATKKEGRPLKAVRSITTCNS